LLRLDRRRDGRHCFGCPGGQGQIGLWPQSAHRDRCSAPAREHPQIRVNALSRLRLDLRLLYLGLAATLALNLFLPFDTLLVPNLAARYALGCAVLFSPILMANLIFRRLFGDTVAPDIAFASNVLGAFIGGTLEYMSLQVGYHLLLVPVIVAYVLSFVAVAYRNGRRGLVPRLRPRQECPRHASVAASERGGTRSSSLSQQRIPHCMDHGEGRSRIYLRTLLLPIPSICCHRGNRCCPRALRN